MLLAVVAVFIIFSILATLLVITASMLSSRLSRVEDRFLTDDLRQEKLPLNSAMDDVPSSIQ